MVRITGPRLCYKTPHRCNVTERNNIAVKKKKLVVTLSITC